MPDRDEYERQREAKAKAEAMAHAISDYLNAYGSERINLLVEELLIDHRTSQQTFTRMVMRWFERLAEAPHGFDGRNELSVKLAREIMAMPDAKRRLPLI